MKHFYFPLLFFIISTLLATVSYAQEKSINKDELHDKIEAFWLGQLVGNYLGLPFENNYVDEAVPELINRIYSIEDETKLEINLGLVAIYQESTDRVWTELTWSPDTKNWFRIDEGNPLIPNSEKELDYDYGCIYACTSPVIEDDKIMLYYGGSDWKHSGWRNGTLCLPTLRPDGFAGYVQQDSSDQGSITTKQFQYDGGALKLTADVEKGGSLIVKVLNSEGKEIATSKSEKTTMTDQKIQLNHQINEDSIAIKIEFSKAKVYSFSIK